ncbi:hypothetical protein B0H19DRAFT_942572, partial [Mycena capillaripes]
VSEWKDTFFVKPSLKKLGHRVQLGHPHGQHCFPPRAANKHFVVIHDNGIHKVAVDFCECEQQRKAGLPYIQLLCYGLYPATEDKPQTCTTFEVLDKFVLSTHQAKMTAYDFYCILERLTNRASMKPPNWYQVLLWMSHQWRHLLMLLRAGRGHDPLSMLGTAPGELALLCPVCPRLHVNLPEGWENAPPEDR